MRNGPYIMVVAPENYPGKKYRGRYIYEHHLVWWAVTNTLVPEGYVIHHKNKDRHDNRFENLELLENREHSLQHGQEKTVTYEKLTCAFCGIVFSRDVRNVRAKKNSGQENFYCCREHQWKGLKK